MDVWVRLSPAEVAALHAAVVNVYRPQGVMAFNKTLANALRRAAGKLKKTGYVEGADGA